MKKEHLSYLVDPLTGDALGLKVFEEKEGRIYAGLLENRLSWYPVINGVPRMLVGNLRLTVMQNHKSFLVGYEKYMPEYVVKEWKAALEEIKDWNRFLMHQKKTGESFAFEWRKIYRENDYEKNNFFHFLSPFADGKDIIGKAIVDIGCGSGRFTKQAVLAGAKIAFGTDIGESVEVAYEMVKKFDNACIIQTDIYTMPFFKSIDFAYSIGVLHHLPEPKNGFMKLPKVLVKGGRMLIWVYNRRGNKRALYFYEPLRAFVKRLPKSVVFKLSYIPALAVHAINFFSHLLNEWGLIGLAEKVPFSYYANFPFNMKLNDAFDVLATPKSNYYTVEEVEKWFADAQLQDIKIHEHKEAGITCSGINA